MDTRRTELQSRSSPCWSLPSGSPSGTANAKGDDDVLVRGTCTARSTVKMKASPENGRLEVELEVDQTGSVAAGVSR